MLKHKFGFLFAPEDGAPAGSGDTPPDKKVASPAKTEVIEDEDDEDAVKLKAETSEALNVYRALQDPKKARVVIETLAREAGLFDGDKSKKQVRDEVESILAESLGEGYEFLAPKLGPAIKKDS